MPASRRVALAIASEDIASSLLMHRVVHVVLTLILFWLSYLFLDQEDSFNLYPTVYSFLAAIATEHTWGIVVLCGALFGMMTSYSRGWIARTAGSGILAVYHIWFGFAFSMGKFDVPSVGMFIGCGILGGCLAYSSAHVGQRFTRRMASIDKPR